MSNDGMTDREHKAIDRFIKVWGMLLEERDSMGSFMTIARDYVRGLHLMADAMAHKMPAGSENEADAIALRRQIADLLAWLQHRDDDLHNLMSRPVFDDAASAGTEEVEQPQNDGVENVEVQVLSGETIH